MTEREWGELAGKTVALVREADPDALAGMTDLSGTDR
jgi:hypothetical protein